MSSETGLTVRLDNVLDETSFTGVGTLNRGKVRDSYMQDDQRLIIVSDRISAFDRVLGTVPLKGQVLNELAAYWFNETSDIVSNHVVGVPDPNAMIVRECKQLPLEFVVRGYITGVTKTSAWTNYKNGVRNLCGNLLPEGLVKDQKLETPIITPTTKLEEHDRNISKDEAIAEGLIDSATFDKAAEICLKLYNRAVEHAASRGLIFVDTKYELGAINGDLVISDEINTPDSSRYWYTDTYQPLFDTAQEQRKLDKEYVRQWLAERGFTGEGVPPTLTDEVREEAARRYVKAYELITGKDFVVHDEPILERVRKAIGAD
jgi:phosphoribosylaminoimidazole-succinocarboxamide synthase